MTQTLTTERLDEIAKLAIRLHQISGCAAATSSGETIMHHTFVDTILSALHDVTAELLAIREGRPDLYLCRVVRAGEVLYSPCGKDYPRGRGYYAAPPAPAVPTFEEWLSTLESKPLGWVRDSMKESYDACRTAMLAQPVSQGYKLNPPETPDGWISCEDRMPVDGDIVLVIQEGGIIYCAEVEGGVLYPDEFPRVPTQGKEITHWMPLPAAPTQGEKQ